MISTKTTKSTLIGILIVALASTTLTRPNFNGCAISFLDGICVECFERKLKLDGSGCGPALPKSDKCLLYSTVIQNNSRVLSCGTCKPGYALRVEFQSDGLIQTCVNATLKNCLIEIDSVYKSGTLRFCHACRVKGEYSVVNQTTAICQKVDVDHTVPNCMWGSLVDPFKKEGTCFRCNDGFALNYLTKQCETTTVTGCWVLFKGRCIACNPFEGYSINSNGTCFKTTTSSGVQRMQVSKILGPLGLGGF